MRSGEAIRAVPFDLKRLSVTGTALAVVDSVAMNPTDGAAAFDVSENGTLAYMPLSSYVTESDLVLRGPARRTRPAQSRPATATITLGSRPTAAASRSTFARPIPREMSGYFRWGARAGPESPRKAGATSAAEWTPDGRELIYSSEHPFYDLYRRAADASRPPQPLVTGGFDRYTGGVSRDGRLLAFMLSAPTTGSELWTVPLDDRMRAARYLANGFDLAHPSISPDGHWMAYDSDEARAGRGVRPVVPRPQAAALEDFARLTARSRCGLGEGASWCIGRVTA